MSDLGNLLKLQPPQESAAAQAAVARRILTWMLVWNRDYTRALQACDEIVAARPIPDRLLQAVYGRQWVQAYEGEQVAA